jgi:hypothetical protein
LFTHTLPFVQSPFVQQAWHEPPQSLPLAHAHAPPRQLLPPEQSVSAQHAAQLPPQSLVPLGHAQAPL